LEPLEHLNINLIETEKHLSLASKLESCIRSDNMIRIFVELSELKKVVRKEISEINEKLKET
jgi:hypothetical protein